MVIWIYKDENTGLTFCIDAYATLIYSDKHAKISVLSAFIEPKPEEMASCRNLKMHNLQFRALTT